MDRISCSANVDYPYPVRSREVARSADRFFADERDAGKKKFFQ